MWNAGQMRLDVPGRKCFRLKVFEPARDEAEESMPLPGWGRAPEAEHPPVEGPAPGAAQTMRRHGKIEVADRAIATVAGRAVAECYGVVGVAARHPRFSAVELLEPEHYGRGVIVRSARNSIVIELYVVLEYGLRVTEIAHNVMENVKFAVERLLGQRAVRVNVNVQALRVTPEPSGLHG
jgi:uncharacterized alkaline shock family protein YloU